jgi:MoxR-like ATPase
MTQQLGRVIIGQSEVLKQVLIALFCQGHCILEGVPGVAKTLMIASIVQLLSLKFGRIQFTPDLMPSDVTGTEILEEEEGTIAEMTTSGDLAEGILAMQRTVRKVLVGRSVTTYAVMLVRATRPASDESPDYVKKYLTWGAGPRACQALLLGAKAHALLDGRVHVSTDDVRYVAKPVLRHRLGTSFRADCDGVKADHIVEMLFTTVREPMER